MGAVGFVGAGSLSVLGSGRPSTGGALAKQGREVGLSRSSRCNVKMVISQEAASSVNSPGTESKLISKTPEWKALKKHAEEEISKTSIKELLRDEDRNASMIVEYDDVVLDFSRQRVRRDAEPNQVGSALTSNLDLFRARDTGKQEDHADALRCRRACQPQGKNQRYDLRREDERDGEPRSTAYGTYRAHKSRAPWHFRQVVSWYYHSQS